MQVEMSKAMLLLDSLRLTDPKTLPGKEEGTLLVYQESTFVGEEREGLKKKLLAVIDQIHNATTPKIVKEGPQPE